MRKTLFALSFLFCISASAQVKFEPGYFISNNGQKTICFIRNKDKNVSPVKFQYKLSENGDIQVATIDSVSSFEILNTIYKFQRFKVKIEHSGIDIKNLLDQKNIVFNDEILFLQVLVEGNASLYVYNAADGVKKFFYSINNGSVNPLVYYKYLDEGNTIGEMNGFKQQLQNDLQCSAITTESLKRIHYTESELVQLFTKFNQCKDVNYKNTVMKPAKGENQLDILIGINTSSLELNQKSAPGAPSSGSMRRYSNTERTSQKVSPAISFSITHLFAFRKGAWAIFIEPGFQVYKNELSDVSIPSGSATTLPINYAFLSLPIGIKHFIYLNDNSKFYLKGAIGYNIVLNSSNVFGTAPTYRTKNGLDQYGFVGIPHFILGAGLLVKKRYSIESKFYINNTMLDNEQWKTGFVNSFSLMFGYRLK